MKRASAPKGSRSPKGTRPAGPWDWPISRTEESSGKLPEPEADTGEKKQKVTQGAPASGLVDERLLQDSGRMKVRQRRPHETKLQDGEDSRTIPTGELTPMTALER